jgi:nucleoside phosphorylase
MRSRGRSAAWLLVAALGVLLAAPAPGAAAPPGLCAAVRRSRPPKPVVAVLAAFPAELAPLVAAADVERTVDIDGRTYYVGRLEGVRVVLALTGIGMVNAATTARSVTDHFRTAGVLMSGVAGSAHRIGDVVIAARWEDPNRPRIFPANPALLAIARRAVRRPSIPLEKCTQVPPAAPDGTTVCMLHDPEVVFGGRGQSTDPFADAALPCVPGAGDVFGCALPADAAATLQRAAATAPDPVDMETAAVAHVASWRRLPFLGIRAVSDGAGDPLGDRGFPAQFFDYYRLAAANAALVTRAVLAEIATLADSRSGHRTCRLLAQRRWEKAAAQVRRSGR